MSQFGPRDLHALAAAQGVDLAAAFEGLRALYADTDARNARNTAGMTLPCHSGCSSCCEEMVFLTPLEFYGAWDLFQRTATASVLEETIVVGLDLYQEHRERIEAFNRPPPDGAVDHTAIAVEISFRCPLLDDEGTCRVYEMREILGRLFGCSFNDAHGIYGCDLSGAYFAERTGGDELVTLTRARETAMQIYDLPLTEKQQAYPWFIHQLYGHETS